MSAKKSMFIVWAVGSILWAVFSSYMFHVKDVYYANHSLNYYQNLYIKGDRSERMRAAIGRAGRRVQEANRNMYLFALVGIGFPGLLLALGTWAMTGVDGPPAGKGKPGQKLDKKPAKK